MRTLHAAHRLSSFTIHALDGEIGHVHDVYFDDVEWKVRYLVVDLGRWIPGRKVLMSMTALGEPDSEQRAIPVTVTREQVRQSPDYSTMMPVDIEQETRLHRHFGWELYWETDMLFTYPLSMPNQQSSSRPQMEPPPVNPHLHSMQMLKGLRLYGMIDMAGRIADFVMDWQSWTIPFTMVTMDAHRRVLMPSHWIKDMDRAKGTGRIDYAYTFDDIFRLPECEENAPTVVCLNQEEEMALFHPASSHQQT